MSDPEPPVYQWSSPDAEIFLGAPVENPTEQQRFENALRKSAVERGVPVSVPRSFYADLAARLGFDLNEVALMQFEVNQIKIVTYVPDAEGRRHVVSGDFGVATALHIVLVTES